MGGDADDGTEHLRRNRVMRLTIHHAIEPFAAALMMFAVRAKSVDQNIDVG